MAGEEYNVGYLRMEENGKLLAPLELRAIKCRSVSSSRKNFRTSDLNDVR